jgi:hypothetical protein
MTPRLLALSVGSAWDVAQGARLVFFLRAKAGLLAELADGGLGEGLARFDGPAGELPGTAPVSAEQDAVRAVHDHTDAEGGVRRRRCVGAGAARHAFRTADRVQPVGDRVLRRRGVDRPDRFQCEAVLDQEVFPQLHAEDPHVHGVVLGCAGQSQHLGARGHLVRGPGAVRVGVQRGEDQASARFEPVGQGGQQPVGVQVRHGADGVDQVVRVGSAQVGHRVGAHQVQAGMVRVAGEGALVLCG